MDKPIWIIMSLVSNVNLQDFLDQYPRRLTFEHILIMTQQLSDIVQRCHQNGVYHRNLHPTNILVQYSFDQVSIKDIHLVLINFSSGSSHDLTRTSSTAQDVIRNDASADMTGICRILLWLLTGAWWESLQSMKSSYNSKRYHSMIFSKLSIAKNDEIMQKEVMYLFQRTFDSSSNQQWSMDEFRKQLIVIKNLLIEKETKQLDVLFPSNSVVVVSAISDPYARAVSLVAQLKQGFADRYCACIKWSTESNRWIGGNINDGLKNIDQLTYRYENQSFDLLVVCSARNETDRLTISVGVGPLSAVDQIEMKRIFRVTAQTLDTDVSKDFEDEMKELIQKHLTIVSDLT